jgi:hypothetical protein
VQAKVKKLEADIGVYVSQVKKIEKVEKNKIGTGSEG